MQTAVIQKLLDLNNEFYQTFGKAFAATRRRVQSGIYNVFKRYPDGGDWLDLGCGSGAVALAWAASPRRDGSYTGLDFSPTLLEEARVTTAAIIQEAVTIQFYQADLAGLDWPDQLTGKKFDFILAFAVLHHIPSSALRKRILTNVWNLLQPNGVFIHSVWQFQHSPKLMARRQPWDAAGLSADQVEGGDTLLDWRYALPNQIEQVGLRYVHLFNRAELQALAASCNFEIIETFESDGEGGKLGLYQVWKKSG